MTDTVYTPAPTDSSGTGFLMGIIVLILFALFFVFYGLPALRGGGTAAPTQQAPAESGGDGVNIEVPDKIDVNVNQPEN